MSYFMKSRHLGPILLITIAVELSLPLWAWRAFKVTHDMSVRAVPIAVPAQFLVVALVLYVVASEFRGTERLAARPMRAYQVLLLLVVAVPLLGAATLASTLIGDTGTLGSFGPLKALIGLWGVGLIATTLLDRRVAGVVPIAGIILPMVLNPDVVPGVEVWGFALEPDSSLTAWWTSVGLFIVGAGVHTIWSDRRRR